MAELLDYSIIGYNDREHGIRKLLSSEGHKLSEAFGIDAIEIVAQQSRYVDTVLAKLSERFYDGVRR